MTYFLGGILLTIIWFPIFNTVGLLLLACLVLKELFPNRFFITLYEYCQRIIGIGVRVIKKYFILAFNKGVAEIDRKRSIQKFESRVMDKR